MASSMVIRSETAALQRRWNQNRAVALHDERRERVAPIGRPAHAGAMVRPPAGDASFGWS